MAAKSNGISKASFFFFVLVWNFRRHRHDVSKTGFVKSTGNKLTKEEDETRCPGADMSCQVRFFAAAISKSLHMDSYYEKREREEEALGIRLIISHF